MSRTVAIVGRPNVGKSRLFNRLARKRISIVHDQPGVTRDIVSAEVKEGEYLLLDTGGLGLQDATTPAKLIKASEDQVQFAVTSSDLILFTVDAREGSSPTRPTTARTRSTPPGSSTASASANPSTSPRSMAAARPSCATRSWPDSAPCPRR
jgi:small GTP-binding protein